MSTRQDGNKILFCPAGQAKGGRMAGQVKNRGIDKRDTMKIFVLSVLEVFLDDLLQ